MSEMRSSLMHQVQKSQFALVETVLYLDTHPYDWVKTPFPWETEDK